jgi:iron complex outermembrane receptor protein
MRVAQTRAVRGLVVAAVLLSAGPAAAQEPVTVTGTVTSSDGTPQAGATVAVDAVGAATLTDEAGRYSLALPPGNHAMRVQSVGQVDVQRNVAVPQAGPLQFDVQMTPDPRTSEVIVVVGSRTPRTQLETSVPVDVITDEAIRESSQTETAQLLNVVAPSFNSSHHSVADGSDHIDPAGLRGLGPEHVLVLLNGKRRQQSALINFYGGGTVGVDYNAIPTGAISRIEVLRDGAASQYGSDAIAGVINVVLKDDVDTANVYTMSGITASGDGEQLKAGANGGLRLGSRGFVNVTGEFMTRGQTNRTGQWTGPIFSPDETIEEGDALLADMGLRRDDFRMSVGQSGAIVGSGFVNAAYPLNPIFELYGHGGYTYRKGKATGFYRFPYEEDRVDTDVYEIGFLPEINPTTSSWTGTVGTRARAGGWEGDLSATYGGDSFHFFVENSLNASLENSPTDFDAGKLAFAQATANLDVVRRFEPESAFLDAFSLVGGGEVRNENYSITAGQPESYETGTVTYDPDPTDEIDEQVPKASGAQVFPGFQPSNESDESRTSEALYLGLESKLFERVSLDVGGRFEHYSDFGNTVIGKVAGRVAAVKTEANEVALRGSVSTGFRAPALQQIWYSTIATNFVNDPVTGMLEPSEIQVTPNRSDVTEAFGIPQLKEETSLNVSGGFTARLFENLSFSADYYRIQIEDRVVLSGLFAEDDADIGATVASILAPFPGVDGAQFFVNSVDTTTNGLDLVVDYTYRLPKGQVSATASANFTRTNVDDVKVPDSVQDIFDESGDGSGPARVRQIFLGRDGRNRLQDQLPRRKGTLGLGTRWLDLTAGVRANYFGPTRYGSTDPALDENYGSEVTFDVDLGYRIGDLRFGIGGNNVFDNFPDENKHEDNRYFNTFLYGSPAGGLVTPFGIEGAFYYVKVDYTL